MTIPGSVEKTAAQISKFDSGGFGFSHDYTWAVMHQALRGVFTPEAVRASLVNKHPRVVKCVEALCALGRNLKLDTRSFADFPDSGLRPISMLQWGPEVSVRVKASCWYIDKFDRPILPILQPRKEPLDTQGLAVYLALVRQAFCKGDWSIALPQLVDLSGEDKDGAEAKIINENELPQISDDLLGDYVRTYVEAKKLAEANKVIQPKKPKDKGMGDLFDRPA
jgi:hypothetical protein